MLKRVKDAFIGFFGSDGYEIKSVGDGLLFSLVSTLSMLGVVVLVAFIVKGFIIFVEKLF